MDQGHLYCCFHLCLPGCGCRAGDASMGDVVGFGGGCAFMSMSSGGSGHTMERCATGAQAHWMETVTTRL